MDEIQKLFRRISQQDRKRIKTALKKLSQGKTKSLNVRKIQNHKNLFRMRVGNYRIIYYDDGVDITLQRIERRSDNTYKNL